MSAFDALPCVHVWRRRHYREERAGTRRTTAGSEKAQFGVCCVCVCLPLGKGTDGQTKQAREEWNGCRRRGATQSNVGGGRRKHSRSFWVHHSSVARPRRRRQLHFGILLRRHQRLHGISLSHCVSLQGRRKKPEKSQAVCSSRYFTNCLPENVTCSYPDMSVR